MAKKKLAKLTISQLRKLSNSMSAGSRSLGKTRTILFRTKKGPLVKRFKSRASAARAYAGWTSTGATARYL